MDELEKLIGITPDSEKPIAPKLELVYSTVAYVGQNKYVPVNGHKNRCLALEAAWKQKFNTDNDLNPIVVVDKAPTRDQVYGMFKKDRVDVSGFCVEITDTSILATTAPDIIINYKYKKQYEYSTENSPLILSGEQWFFCDDTWYINGFVSSDKPNIVIIPNGNKERFFSSLNIQDVYSSLRNGSVTIVHNLDRDTLLDFVDLSSVVITTPSVTAMEIASFGIPQLLIQTSEDQNEELANGDFAYWYSETMLNFILANKDCREVMGEKARAAIKNNIESVCELILNEWEGKNK